MSTSTTSSAMGRILALLIAIALCVIGWLIWQAVERDKMAVADTPTASALTELGMTPAIEACIDKRTAEINALVDDGFYTRERADQDIAAASSLCVQQDATPRATQF